MDELVVYALQDRRMREFGVLMCAPNEDVARRQLADAMRMQPEWLPARYPDDFDVYAVALYAPRTGTVIAVNPPRLLSTLSEVRQQFGLNGGSHA